jgi:3-deoxy-manno-octulosonate cytidylyltransferase (CMP-KDO synthetase)
LEQLTSAEPCELERLEQLEQLRALWLGMEIRVELAENQHGPDVDTEADLIRVEEILAADMTGRKR